MILLNHKTKTKKYTVAKTRFSLAPFKYLFYIPTRPLVIFNYEICEVIFYDFIAEMFATHRCRTSTQNKTEKLSSHFLCFPRLEK